MEAAGYKIRGGYPRVDCGELWEQHRRRTWICWGMFFGWIPYGAAVFRLLSLIHLSESPVIVILLGGYILTWVVLGCLVGQFRCPRCGGRFYAWGPWGLGHNGFKRSCRNCGLRKYQCDDVSSASS
jgi:hypothetical protein